MIKSGDLLLKGGYSGAYEAGFEESSFTEPALDVLVNSKRG